MKEFRRALSGQTFLFRGVARTAGPAKKISRWSRSKAALIAIIRAWREPRDGEATLLEQRHDVVGTDEMQCAYDDEITAALAQIPLERRDPAAVAIDDEGVV